MAYPQGTRLAINRSIPRIKQPLKSLVVLIRLHVRNDSVCTQKCIARILGKTKMRYVVLSVSSSYQLRRWNSEKNIAGWGKRGLEKRI